MRADWLAVLDEPAGLLVVPEPQAPAIALRASAAAAQKISRLHMPGRLAVDHESERSHSREDP